MAFIQDSQQSIQIQPNAGLLDSLVYLSQNENGRKLYFKLLGIDEIPTGSTATFSGTKPDGNIYSATGTIDGLTVVVEETMQMTAVAGTWDAKIKIINGGNTLATAKTRIVVDPSTDTGVESDSVLEGIVAECQAYAESARSAAYGSPLTASTAAAMTDITRVYVYTGSEDDYTNGNWYYYNGTAWVSGGVYNSTAVQTDTTLSVSGKAADAKATGDEITDLKEDINERITVLSPVGAMVEIAEGYFDQAYTSGTHLVYDSTHGLFAPQTTSSVVGEEGYPAIVCSQFAQALMMGIKYSQSRYSLSANHISDWGYTSDGTGVYVYTSEEMTDLPSQDYMIAKQQCKYAIDHGWIYEITDVRRQVRPGDFIFYGLADVDSWEDITHVALVLHAGYDDGYMITLESDDQTVNSKRVGVVSKRFAIAKSGGHYLYGARFPVDGSLITPKLILADSSLSGTNSSYAVKQYTLDKTYSKGFYTAVIDGTFVSTRIEIGLHYTDAATDTYDYTRGRVVKNGGRYATTFYADRDFNKVRLGSTANKAYTINKWCLFKGYYGMNWLLP